LLSREGAKHLPGHRPIVGPWFIGVFRTVATARAIPLFDNTWLEPQATADAVLRGLAEGAHYLAP